MITDWKGNEIKPGMEVAFLQTEIHHPEMSWLMPGFGIQKIAEAYTEKCFELSEFRIVEGYGDDLYFTIKTPSNWPEKGCTIFSQVKLNGGCPFSTGKPVLAIKGVSDKNPNE